MNVLVYPSGTEIGLEIGRSLQFSKHFHAIGLNSTHDHSEIIFNDMIYDSPTVYQKEALRKKICEVVKERNIKIIIPSHDEIIVFFSEIKIEGVVFIVPDLTLSNILRYKSSVYQQFVKCQFIPKVFEVSRIKKTDFPLFLRPNRGQGSSGAKKILNFDDLNNIDESNVVITEYLPGEEYTVDCFSTLNGKLLFVSSRKRDRIRSGISVRVIEVAVEEFRELSEIINERLCPKGAWFFQCKRDTQGKIKLMEVANRIAGSVGYQRIKGINLVIATLFNALGYPVLISEFTYFPEFVYERAFSHEIKVSCNFSSVYVDFDDTLLLEGNEIHYELVGMLYGLKLNRNMKIILISKHDGNLFGLLEKYKLHFLFDKIIHLSHDKEKVHYIEEEDFIFVDDSFSERIEVQKKFPKSVCFGPESICFIRGMLQKNSSDK
ncbi:MAG: ATP-grasp domain-containing protein [Gammaproteobacteria bacterium]|nr:ATP-grasp domain-containing protein [Gammaproteobacteria bacterium]